MKTVQNYTNALVVWCERTAISLEEEFVWIMGSYLGHKWWLKVQMSWIWFNECVPFFEYTLISNFKTLKSGKVMGQFIDCGGKVRWPRELNALQLQKTHANRKSSSKSRKHHPQFASRCRTCSQHKYYFLFGCVVSIYSVYSETDCVS